jgi:dTDP-4-dehydrorhamnose reductase
MKVLVTGGGGMLAHTLVPTLRGAGYEVRALTREELDVTDRVAVDHCLQQVRPSIVVQCAAYTAVDRAEEEEGLARMVNAEATGYVADACQKVGATLVYPSTDYVFAGSGDRAYGPDDEPGPLNAYGRSKLAGERAAARCDDCLVVRTSWLYGAGGRNFVDTIRRLAGERDRLEVVDDQTGRPTSTVEFSRAITLLLKVGALGTFHAAGGGPPTTWYGFAKEIVAQLGLDVEVEPIASSRAARLARRPAHSVLECGTTETLIGQKLADWQDALSEYLQH